MLRDPHEPQSCYSAPLSNHFSEQPHATRIPRDEYRASVSLCLQSHPLSKNKFDGTKLPMVVPPSTNRNL
jgi:hypothetical protein